MLNPDFGEAPDRLTVEEPTSTVTTPPIRSYDRMSVAGGTVVVVGAVVVVVVGTDSIGADVVVVGAMVVVVLVVDGRDVDVVVDGDTPAVVGADESGAGAAAAAVVGTIAVGASVTWSRTLPTAAAATTTAVVVTASHRSA